MKTVKKCANCNKKIKVKRSCLREKNFCSMTCYKKYRLKNSFKMVYCKQCKKKFKASTYVINKTGGGKYCSIKCCGLSQRVRQKLICIECGKKFEIKKSHFKRTGGKYCSVKCMNKNRENKIKCKCSKCKKAFYRVPGLVFRGKPLPPINSFCNVDCYISYHGGTSIEKTIEKSLKLLKIRYSKQKKICIKTCKKVKGLKRITYADFFVKPNLCIYVDGKYWHSLKRVCKKDKMVNKNLPVMGFKVIRILEGSITKTNKYLTILKRIKNKKPIKAIEIV